MSKIISFSVDDSFAQSLENLIDASGYQNRSRFLRDAAVAFADMKRRGELSEMADEEVVEGHIVVYYQHDAEGKTSRNPALQSVEGDLLPSQLS